MQAEENFPDRSAEQKLEENRVSEIDEQRAASARSSMGPHAVGGVSTFFMYHMNTNAMAMGSASTNDAANRSRSGGSDRSRMRSASSPVGFRRREDMITSTSAAIRKNCSVYLMPLSGT